MARFRLDLAILVSALGAVGVAAPGCHKEDIQTYAVPKAIEVKDEPVLGDAPKERMLGAVIPHGDEVWFLKMQGPEKDIEAHKAIFDQVLHSFHFLDQKDKPVAWVTPPGWTSQPEKQNRYATLVLDKKDTPLELSITRLPGGGNVVANVNRWRGQLSLNPVTWADLPKVTTQVKLESTTAICTDFVGIAKKSASMAGGPERPPAGREPAEEANGKAPFEYTMPNGWTVVPDKGGAIRPVAAFQVVEGNQEATITVTRLAGQSGSIAMNVNRWRGQVDLPEASPEDLKRDVQEFTVAGNRSPYVDLLGPKTGGRGPQRMLAAAVSQGDSTWYFKILGPADLIGRQKPAFEAFMSSVRFRGGPNG